MNRVSLAIVGAASLAVTCLFGWAMYEHGVNTATRSIMDRTERFTQAKLAAERGNALPRFTIAER